MNQKDDLPLPHANPEPGNDDSPDNPERRRVLTGIAAVGFGFALAGCNTEEQAAGTPKSAADLRLDAALHDQVRHIVVIYAENRSFANL